MSYEIALINPRAKPRKSRKKRGAKVAKRKRRKMSAKQLKFFGGARTRRRRRSRSKSTAVAVRRANPRRRRAHSVVRHFKRRRRSNPRLGGSGVVGQVIGTLVPAGIGAAGVLAVDRVIGYLPLASLSADPAMQKHINRAARLIAVAGVGIAARKFLGGEQGAKVAVSAMGIAIHGLLSGFLGSGAGLSGELDGYSTFSPAPVFSGDMDGDDMGAYLQGDEIVPLIGADDMGADDLGAYLQGDMDGDTISAYLQGDND